MNLRRYILGTMTANLALVGALLWQTARPSAPVLRSKLVATTNVVTEVVSDPVPQVPEVNVPGSPPFHWSQVESTNYSVYLTQLIAIGCPHETVRDILEARVADDFRARLRELTRPLQVRFWDVLAETGELEELLGDPSVKKATEVLKAEKERVQAELETVLSHSAKPEKAGRDESASHLPEEKQSALTALDSRHAQERDVLKQAAAKAAPAARAAQEKELHQRHKAERRALFTDAEWAEAELRRAAEQNVTVRGLRGFAATPDQLRSLQLAWRDFEAAHPHPTKLDLNPANNDADYWSKVKAREAQRKGMLTARLGEAGFTAFERGSDPRFHTLLKLSRRLDLPSATAVQWLEIRNSAQEQVRQTRQLAALSDDARALALIALRAETERTLRSAVGPRGWSAYQRYAGDWLKQVSE